MMVVVVVVVMMVMMVVVMMMVVVTATMLAIDRVGRGAAHHPHGPNKQTDMLTDHLDQDW